MKFLTLALFSATAFWVSAQNLKQESETLLSELKAAKK